MQIRITITFLLSFLAAFAQESSDTLNQYNEKHKKTGYWVCYLDSSFNLASQENAKYYGFENYDNGKNPIKSYFKVNWRKNYKIVYTPNGEPHYKDGLLLIDGTVTYYHDTVVLFIERYKNGFTKEINEFVIHPYPDKSVKIEPFTTVYYDSLHNGNRETALLYDYKDGSAFYKEPLPLIKHSPNRVYLVPGRPYHTIHKLRAGYHYQERSFVEVGYSFKNTGGFEFENGGKHIQNEKGFMGFSTSLLGSFKSANSYFGQQILLSYNTPWFTCFEIGAVNYTNFNFTQNDTRATLGAGISLIGRFSIMYHYSIPLADNHFSNISRHSMGIVLF